MAKLLENPVLKEKELAPSSRHAILDLKLAENEPVLELCLRMGTV